MNVILRDRNGFPIPVAVRSGTVNESFERLVDSIFEDMLKPVSTATRPKLDEGTPRMNVVETENEYKVEAELPGVSKEDVKISVDGKHVSFEAEVKRETEQKEGERVLHAERVARKFTRSFTLPSEVDETRAEAKLESGILKLTLPKKQETQPKHITVQ
jgi:HSP20 family protein